MSRPLRIRYPGAVYHVTCRGNERRDIFRLRMKMIEDKALNGLFDRLVEKLSQ
jgi:REP element-mobilizing transposase RayT